MNPIDFNGLDTAVHGPIRLGIMTALQVDGPLDFTTLKKRLATVDGSLNLRSGKFGEQGPSVARGSSPSVPDAIEAEKTDSARAQNSTKAGSKRTIAKKIGGASRGIQTAPA